MLVASKKQLQVENDTLRKTTTDMIQQLKTSEQRVADRFTSELKAQAEQLQMETVKTTSLNTFISTLKDSENTVRKELDKFKNENRFLSVKYTNQASEHAAAFTVRYWCSSELLGHVQALVSIRSPESLAAFHMTSGH